MDKKILKKRIGKFIKKVFYIAYAFVFIFAFVWAINEYNTNPIMQPIKHNYECDGENIQDKCSYGKLKNGGVLIRGCTSGKEYFCQSATELPIEKPIVEYVNQSVWDDMTCWETCHENFDTFEPDFELCWERCNDK